METAISQDVLKQRAEDLLAEWGECQRREPRVIRAAGNPIASLMRNYGRRSKGRTRGNWAYSRRRRLVEVKDPDGTVRKVPALSMAPERADRQSVVMVETQVRWPEHIERVDRVLAKLPEPLLRTLYAYYVAGHSIRTGAEVLRVDRNEFALRLERSTWWLIGKFDEIDQ